MALRFKCSAKAGESCNCCDQVYVSVEQDGVFTCICTWATSYERGGTRTWCIPERTLDQNPMVKQILPPFFTSDLSQWTLSFSISGNVRKVCPYSTMRWALSFVSGQQQIHVTIVLLGTCTIHGMEYSPNIYADPKARWMVVPVGFSTIRIRAFLLYVKY